jgi:hypothetical protein
LAPPEPIHGCQLCILMLKHASTYRVHGRFNHYVTGSESEIYNWSVFGIN